MKKSNFVFFAFILISIFSCKDDDCHVEKQFNTYEVDFYSSHKKYKIKPPTFQIQTEQVLAKQAHLEGAIFELVTEQFLVKEGYKRLQIMDSMMIQLLTDSEIDSFTQIACYHFYDESEFVEIDVPAEYQTRVSERVVEQGTGSEVPAVYETITRKLLATNSELIENTDEQTYNRLTFKLPEDRSIRELLDYSFEQNFISHCKEGNSYIIHD